MWIAVRSIISIHNKKIIIIGNRGLKSVWPAKEIWNYRFSVVKMLEVCLVKEKYVASLEIVQSYNNIPQV